MPTFTGFTLSGDAVETIHINPDGSFDYGYKTETKSNAGETIITVGGNVSGSVSAQSIEENSVQITVKGSINNSSYPNGINASTSNGKTEIHVEGDVFVEPTGEKPYDGPGRSSTGITATT